MPQLFNALLRTLIKHMLDNDEGMGMLPSSASAVPLARRILYGVHMGYQLFVNALLRTLISFEAHRNFGRAFGFGMRAFFVGAIFSIFTLGAVFGALVR